MSQGEQQEDGDDGGRKQAAPVEPINVRPQPGKAGPHEKRTGMPLRLSRSCARPEHRGKQQGDNGGNEDGPAHHNAPTMARTMTRFNPQRVAVLTFRLITGVPFGTARQVSTLQAGRFERVLQQHGDGHRADAAGNRRNRRRHFPHRRRNRHRRPTCHPASRFMPTSTTTAPGRTMSAVRNALADGHDDNVGRARQSGDVRAAAMADGDGGIGAWPFCMSMSASGLPTMLLRPTMTTCLPATAILLRTSNC